MQYSVRVNNARLDSIETTVGTAPTLQLWNGTKPANTAASDTGTKVAQGVLPSDWLANASAGAKSKAGTWSATGLSAAGTGMYAHYFRIVAADSNVDGQGFVANAWVASTAYPIGYQVVNGGNVYRATAAGTSAASGGPTGTGGSITDGTVTWAYQGADAGPMSIDNPLIANAQAVTVNTVTITAGNT